MYANEKTLELGGNAVKLVSERVTLELGAVGRARFVVAGLEASPGNVPARYLLGMREQGSVFPVMVGVVTEAALTAPGEWAVTVRELSAMLQEPAAFAIRHCYPADVLAELEKITGLEFLLPAMVDGGDYLIEQLPHYAGAGSCRTALEAMGAAWGLADAVWCGLPDGRIYWGPWASGPWGTEALEIDPALVVSREERALLLPVIPQFRPGLLVQDTGAGTGPVMIQRCIFSGDNVRIEWGEI